MDNFLTCWKNAIPRTTVPPRKPPSVGCQQILIHDIRHFPSMSRGSILRVKPEYSSFCSDSWSTQSIISLMRDRSFYACCSTGVGLQLTEGTSGPVIWVNFNSPGHLLKVYSVVVCRFVETCPVINLSVITVPTVTYVYTCVLRVGQLHSPHFLHSSGNESGPPQWETCD